MKLSLLLIPTLILTTSSAIADTYVESNYTYASKFIVQNKEPTLKGDIESQTYATVSIKNADIIQDYAEANLEDISSKARIIRQDRYNEAGDLLEVKMFIRDGAEEYNITSAFAFDDPEKIIYKFKRNEDTHVGTTTEVCYAEFDLTIDWEDEEDSYIWGGGTSVMQRRRILSKSDDSIYNLDSQTLTFHGTAFMYNVSREKWYRGPVNGTMKYSGAKVVPAPAPAL